MVGSVLSLLEWEIMQERKQWLSVEEIVVLKRCKLEIIKLDEWIRAGEADIAAAMVSRSVS